MASTPRKARRKAAKATAAADARPRFSTINARHVTILGGRVGLLQDVYHGLLTIPWWAFYLLLFGVYLSANLIFAGLYWVDPTGVAGANPHDFADDFFFSVQTLSTIGYGAMTPKSAYVNVVVTGEAFSGLGIVALTTGLIFARVSKPTARVIFSRFAVVTTLDGVTTLMFRAANQRGNQILEAEATVSLLREITSDEGLTLRRFDDLRLVRARSPMFTLTWLIMHRIDEASPLYGATAESLAANRSEVLVTLNGVDEVFAQRIYARHSYLPDEILWNRQLVDMLSFDEEGRRVVNYYNFHKVSGGPDDRSH